MAKTHLEHRPVKFKPGYGYNITTYNPYANYDPYEGVTTAIILGKNLLCVR